MTVRRVITVLAFALWATMTFLTLYVLVTQGLDILVAISALICVLLGAAVLGVIGERR